jgi:hypothetical protein
MSAATPRTISNAPDLRQLLAAVGALILAVALLVAVTISRQASFEATSAVAPATVNHDHGWSSSAGSQDLVVSTANGGIQYTGIPYVTFPRPIAPVATGIVAAPAVPYVTFPQAKGLVVATQNGGILYTGIPYAAPGSVTSGLVPAPGEFRLAPGNLQPVGVEGASTGQGGSNGTRFPQ